MKPLFAVLGISLALVLAAPAHAEPGVDESPTSENNESFLADLHKVGIGFGDGSAWWRNGFERTVAKGRNRFSYRLVPMSHWFLR